MFGFVVVVSFAVLILNIIELNSYILNPSKEAVKKREEVLETAEQIEDFQIEYQKSLDTDQDGLSDFEELNIYNTSPYLPDSDSDGISDKEEIDQGTDPNCPKGENCDVAVPEDGSEEEIFGDIKPDDGVQFDNPFAGMDLENPDPQKLREILLDTGQLTKEQLDQVDDATLLEIYRQVIEEVDQNVNNSVGGL